MKPAERPEVVFFRRSALRDAVMREPLRQLVQYANFLYESEEGQVAPGVEVKSEA